MRTGAGCCRAELIYVTTELYHFNMLMTLEIGQQQCCIICVQFTCRATKMTQRLISAFSQDQSAIKCLKFCSTATRLHYRRRKSRLRRSTLPRPVCESSFWPSKEVDETSHNRNTNKPTGASLLIACDARLMDAATARSQSSNGSCHSAVPASAACTLHIADPIRHVGRDQSSYLGSEARPEGPKPEAPKGRQRR